MQEPITDHRGLWTRAEQRWGKHGVDLFESQRYLDAERRIVGDLDPSTTETGGSRPTNWILALHNFETFARVEGRTPRENSRVRGSVPASERRLGEWARYQRRFEDGLCAYQRARLDVSPHFVWDIGESAWKHQFDACVRFRLSNRRLPALTSQDDDEFALARWLGRQLKALQLGLLRSDRSSRIEQLFGLEI